MQLRKVCVDVTVRYSREGGARPLSLVWEDRTIPIDKVKAVEHAPARVGALLPVRYTCTILGKDRWLYFEPERQRWFVEAKTE